jgi:hypothetical protein
MIKTAARRQFRTWDGAPREMVWMRMPFGYGWRSECNMMGSGLRCVDISMFCSYWGKERMKMAYETRISVWS